MKVIDEKGRLFGKINLIDLLVLILVVAVIAVLGWKFVGKSAATAATSTQHTVTYTVVCEDVQKDICTFAQSQIGSALISSGKVLDASVAAVSMEESVVTPGHFDLYLEIEADTTFSSSVYTLGSQELRVGYEHIVKTSEFELTGLICDMEVFNG